MVHIPSVLDFDMVIKNGTVVTASDECRCDIGIKDGIIRVLADDIPEHSGITVIDAEGGFITVRIIHRLINKLSFQPPYSRGVSMRQYHLLSEGHGRLLTYNRTVMFM